MFRSTTCSAPRNFCRAPLPCCSGALVLIDAVVLYRPTMTAFACREPPTCNRGTAVRGAMWSGLLVCSLRPHRLDRRHGHWCGGRQSLRRS